MLDRLGDWPEEQTNQLSASQHKWSSFFISALHGPVPSKAETGAIHSLQGHVFFSEEVTNNKVHIHWCCLNGVLKMNPVDSAAIPRPPSAKARQNGTTEGIHDYFIVFTGFHLQLQVLKDWIKSCCKPAPVKLKLKMRKDLSDKEITEISSNHRFDPLPPGWFYNGSHYVSLTGDKDYSHPLLETFIEDYLLAVNKDIKRHNTQTVSQPSVDLFTKPESSSWFTKLKYNLIWTQSLSLIYCLTVKRYLVSVVLFNYSLRLSFA